jgi:MacB-like periplasmic core domain
MLRSELRVALRAVLRRPAIYLACIGTLSLGIGAAAAVFNWCNGILLNPYPAIRDSGELVVLSSRTQAGATDALSYPDIQTYQETATDLRDIVATAAAIQPLALTTEGNPDSERVLGHAVSGTYFETLRIPIAPGRGFRREEDTTRATHAVAVISHGLWMRRFAADQDIVGKTIHLNLHPFTVVGVASQNFAGTLLGLTVDVWTPLTMQEQLRGVTLVDRRDRWLIGLGRLQPGRTRETAEAQLQVIARGIEAADPIDDARQPALLPVWRSPWGAQGGMGPVLMILGAVAVLVMGLSSLNAANLLLAHAVERQRQFSIQLMVGSKLWRLVAQLLMEGAFVAAISCTLGLLIAFWAADLLTTLIPPTDNTIADAHAICGIRTTGHRDLSQCVRDARTVACRGSTVRLDRVRGDAPEGRNRFTGRRRRFAGPDHLADPWRCAETDWRRCGDRNRTRVAVGAGAAGFAGGGHAGGSTFVVDRGRSDVRRLCDGLRLAADASLPDCPLHGTA